MKNIPKGEWTNKRLSTCNAIYAIGKAVKMFNADGSKADDHYPETYICDIEAISPHSEDCASLICDAGNTYNKTQLLVEYAKNSFE